MIALSIAMTWLTLTAAGFLALSALGRIEARSDIEAYMASLEREPISDRSLVPAHTRPTVSRALLG
jgi:hypothetical protein